MNKYIKEGLIRAVVGIPVAVFIGQLVIVGLGIGKYLPFKQGEWLTQLMLLSFIGCYFAVSSVVFVVDHWSMKKKNGVYGSLLLLLLILIYVFPLFG